MANELMSVNYETALGNVQLDPDTVKQYLVRGNGSVSDQEVYLFVKMCQAQKLNPFVTGEVHLIKFGTQPAQMVVGYDTYKRRAEDNPNHLFFESGIVVCRGGSGEIVQKKGACLYPTENLLGGWCKVHKMRGDREVVTYKEVGFNEYNKGNAIWKEKPCTMIEKVAISQCLREAYPKDYEGLYTAEELAPAQYAAVVDVNGEMVNDEDPAITQSERQTFFAKVKATFGKERGTDVIRDLLATDGLEDTSKMTMAQYGRIMARLDELVAAEEQLESGDDSTTED